MFFKTLNFKENFNVYFSIFKFKIFKLFVDKNVGLYIYIIYMTNY